MDTYPCYGRQMGFPSNLSSFVKVLQPFLAYVRQRRGGKIGEYDENWCVSEQPPFW
jgi:hypothetical protein